MSSIIIETMFGDPAFLAALVELEEPEEPEEQLAAKVAAMHTNTTTKERDRPCNIEFGTLTTAISRCHSRLSIGKRSLEPMSSAPET
jgi:hypothetical protein